MWGLDGAFLNAERETPLRRKPRDLQRKRQSFDNNILHNIIMARDREEDYLADRSRRRRHSASISPEPYRERRRSRERRRRESRDTDSRSRERNKRRRRYSPGRERPRWDRSQSPRRLSDRRYEGERRHGSSRREDEYRADPSRGRYRPSPPPATSRSRREDNGKYTPMKGSRALPSQQDAFKGDTTVKGAPPVERQKPNFSTTGRLAAESNTIKSTDGQAIVLKYHEPPEARKPPLNQAWRMYVFKGPEIMDTVELSQRSCWLFGREAAVVDLLLEHPSCSKQHAVVQFRYVEERNEWGDKTGRVTPYLIDLESANGTNVNGEDIPAARYLELRDKDILKFGHSTREYVIQLHDEHVR